MTIFLSLNMFLTSCPHISPPHLRKLMTYHTFEDYSTTGCTAHSRRALGPQKKESDLPNGCIFSATNSHPPSAHHCLGRDFQGKNKMLPVRLLQNHWESLTQGILATYHLLGSDNSVEFSVSLDLSIRKIGFL